MNILFIGDITGEPGRAAIAAFLDPLRQEFAIDLTIANVDNAAHGLGVTPKIARDLLARGIDILTGGNHLFDRKEMLPEIGDLPRLLRGYNYPGEVPGAGVYIGMAGEVPFMVTTLIGRTYMGIYENPFSAIDEILEEHGVDARVRIVDFHAEATSEKIAFARYVDGRVSAVVGTHTHVQTADEQILPIGTAYISDVGMTGPHDGIIGMSTGTVLPRFLTGLPTRFEPAEGQIRLHAVVIDVDESTGSARSITRIRRDLA